MKASTILFGDDNYENKLMVTAKKNDTSEEGISRPCENKEFEDSYVVDTEKIDISEALNDSVKEPNAYFQVDNLKTDSEVISGP
ncbi:hypothetical protein CTI12_AA086950 [Artemisia annua]|uniref:Uncharacterized protein n=1 Tax=Artemisia annua TaxID=35608 RepID=A0A2U1Q1H8_ARTAN|nr:hypothetical protein CTI12_AA086950 [Artemisia annua]